MISATVFEAKTKLSELIRQVQGGETVMITSGRERTPVARLDAIQKKEPKRLGARLNPDFKVSEDFWDPLPEEELRLWEGGEG